jgi:hypothetical protein
MPDTHHIDLLLFLLSPLSFVAFVVLPAIFSLFFFRPCRESIEIVSLRKDKDQA